MSSFSPRTKPEVRIIDEQAVTNSLNVAWAFHIDHDRLLADIHAIDCTETFKANFVEASYTDQEGQTQILYRMTRDGFAYLIRAYANDKTEAIKDTYMQEFHRMEEQLEHLHEDTHNPHLMSRVEILKIQAAIEAERRLLSKFGGYC